LCMLQVVVQHMNSVLLLPLLEQMGCCLASPAMDAMATDIILMNAQDN